MAALRTAVTAPLVAGWQRHLFVLTPNLARDRSALYGGIASSSVSFPRPNLTCCWAVAVGTSLADMTVPLAAELAAPPDSTIFQPDSSLARGLQPALRRFRDTFWRSLAVRCLPGAHF